ncbi:MAG TPA: TIGR04551 family protein [Polyangiales bacterium]
MRLSFISCLLVVCGLQAVVASVASTGSAQDAGVAGGKPAASATKTAAPAAAGKSVAPATKTAAPTAAPAAPGPSAGATTPASGPVSSTAPETQGSSKPSEAPSAASATTAAPASAAASNESGALPSASAAETGAQAPVEAPAAAAATPAAAVNVAPEVALPAAPSVPSPGELGDRLVGDLTQSAEPKGSWTAPTPVLTLHGYLRVRGELMDHFWLGRLPVSVYAANPSNNASVQGLGPDPFTRFRPIERSATQADCGSAGVTTDLNGQPVCSVGTLQQANMRLRLSPQLNVSEDVRVKATFDVFDNVVLGQGPQTFYGSPSTGNRDVSAAFASTDLPTSQTIVARRAWAEVRNRDLGELRFGIMPQHWGLGMLYNDGNGLDHDYSTDLGRVMGITKVAGFYLTASYDFLAEGVLGKKSGQYVPDFDGSQIDDVDQFSFSVARRVPDEEEEAVLQRGDAMINGGLHFTMRHQGSLYNTVSPTNPTPSFTTLNATMYTPDVWGQLRYRGLRLELEGAWVAGHMRNLGSGGTYAIEQGGAVLESELRLLNKKLAIYFFTGVATGDSNVEGLSSDANYIDQLGNGRSGADRTISTFRFNPSYRIDTILWRSIMRQVTGAYYFRPGVSYDFVRDDFGQLFGARLDVIWSRAASFMQTPGNASDLGVELNAQVYWRSDDGPGHNDGYHAALQYGVLFPMRGLGYYNSSSSLDTAQSVRLLLGVVF